MIERVKHGAAARSDSGREDSELTLAFTSYGVRVGVVLPDSKLADEALSHLPQVHPLAEPESLDITFRFEWLDDDASPIGRAGFHAFVDQTFANWSPDREYAADAIERKLQHYIAEFAHPQLFVHAGVVGWRGRAIVLPGRSFSGKSTLVKALVDAGADYLSDEYAVLDVDGRVHPYPRRLSLREGPLGPAGRIDLTHRVPTTDLSDRPVTIGLVALLTYERGNVWRVERLTPAEAIMGMCEHTVAIQRRPQDAFAILGRVSSSAVTIRGIRGDVHDAVTRLLELASCRQALSDKT